MFVMVLYFEPQILYGMTRPTKMQRCQASSYQWKADTARQSLPTLLYGGFIKWHHTAVRDNQEKNSRSIERLFFYRLQFRKKYTLRKPFKSIALPQLFANNAILITKTQYLDEEQGKACQHRQERIYYANCFKRSK